MNHKKRNTGCLLAVAAGFVILAGLLASGWLAVVSGAPEYPAAIAKTFDEPQHRLLVPGETDVTLTRTGAYAVYYEYRTGLAPQELPDIRCMLTSLSTGERLYGAPDHVEGNQYSSESRDVTGVLILSFTVPEAGDYTFYCHCPEGRRDLPVVLAPNYAWEFIRLGGGMALSMLGAMAVMCGSLLVGLVLFVSAVVLLLQAAGKQV